jgi:hypothetical protein
MLGNWLTMFSAYGLSSLPGASGPGINQERIKRAGATPLNPEGPKSKAYWKKKQGKKRVRK